MATWRRVETSTPTFTKKRRMPWYEYDRSRIYWEDGEPYHIMRVASPTIAYVRPVSSTHERFMLMMEPNETPFLSMTRPPISQQKYEWTTSS